MNKLWPNSTMCTVCNVCVNSPSNDQLWVSHESVTSWSHLPRYLLAAISVLQGCIQVLELHSTHRNSPDYFVCTGGADTFIELASGPQQAGHESVMSESLVAPKKTNFGAPVEHQVVNFFRKKFRRTIRWVSWVILATFYNTRSLLKISQI